MSLGGAESSQALQDAVNYAWSRNVVVVAAAGNSGSSVRSYPGACDNVVCVASTNESDTRSYFSSYGSWVDVAAPGSNILSTVRGGGYAYSSGTSMATPLVAGEAALVFAAAGPGASADQVVRTITSTMDALPDATLPGRVNFSRAVSRLASGGAITDCLAPAWHKEAMAEPG
jgi:thermitase